MYPVTELSVYQFIAVLSHKNGFLIDMNILKIVIVKNDETVHQRPEYFHDFVFREM